MLVSQFMSTAEITEFEREILSVKLITVEIGLFLI